MGGGDVTDSPLLLVFDVGLSQVKAVLFDNDGAIIDRAAIRYQTHRVARERAEQDPEDWWRSMVQATSDLRVRDPDAMSRVVGVTVTGHMHALVCLDKGDAPVGRAFVLGDRRARDQADRLQERVGRVAMYETTGTLLDASMPAAEIVWLQEREPDRWARTRSVVGCKDFLRRRLTGDRFTDPIDACATSLYDLARADWSTMLLDAVALDSSYLPEIRRPEEVAGVTIAEAPRQLGLRAGIPVVVGSGDDIEVLGCGLLEHGAALEHLGTTGSMLAVSQFPGDLDLALERYPHPIDGLWVVGGSMTTAAAALAWAASMLGYDSIDAAAGSIRPLLGPQPTKDAERRPIFLPSLAGDRVPRRDPAARGAWVDLAIDHDREDLMAAAFEGVAFSLRLILERIEEVVGPVRSLAASEAGRPDNDWLALRASVYETPLTLTGSSEPTALGAMILLAAGLGIHPNIREATVALARVAGVVKPAPSGLDGLRDDYSRFQSVSKHLRGADAPIIAADWVQTRSPATRGTN